MHSLQSSFFEQPRSAAPTAPYVGKFIYETKGRAREYRELACNLYSGCDHRCVYCYAPDVMRADRQVFDVPKPREGILRNLEKDAAGYGAVGEQRQVLFCFACDPYQAEDERWQLTRSAIQICHRYGLSISTLTKGGSRALRDLDLFTRRDSFASTLTFLNAEDSAKWEPGAASPDDRMSTLEQYHLAGIPTWVSLEPVIDPAVTLEIIRKTHRYVDEFKVGTLNYHPRAGEINWKRFANQVRDELESLGCKYYLKIDLRKYL